MSVTDEKEANDLHPPTKYDETTIPDENPKTRAKEFVRKATILNRSGKFVEEALKLTLEAVKYDPRLIDGWIELAECHHRKPDIEKAIEALEKALIFTGNEDEKHQILLRKLSALVRQQSFDTPELKIAAVLRSVDLAKQALRSDFNDGENHYNLAKAYMCLFFVTECVDHQLISLSRAAYQKAIILTENMPIPNQASEIENMQHNHLPDTKSLLKQSDFLFNFSTVLLYCQEFDLALDYLRKAKQLDPNWAEPKNVEECIVQYIKQTYSISEELTKNSKKILKRYTKVVEPLKNVDKIETIIQLDQQRIHKLPTIKASNVTLDDLKKRMQSEDNINLISNTVELLHLKLINMVNCNQAMYITFVAMDVNYAPIIVTIHNLAASTCPGLRDIVTIVNPKIETININNLCPDKGQHLSYSRINVREFKDFYVNGFWVKNDQVAKPQFSVSTLP